MANELYSWSVGLAIGGPSKVKISIQILTFNPGRCSCIWQGTWYTNVRDTSKMSTAHLAFGAWFLVSCVLSLSLAQGISEKSFCLPGFWILGAKTEIGQAWLKVWMNLAITCFVFDWFLLSTCMFYVLCLLVSLLLPLSALTRHRHHTSMSSGSPPSPLHPTAAAGAAPAQLFTRAALFSSLGSTARCWLE